MVHNVPTEFSQGLALNDCVITEKGQPGGHIWYGKPRTGLLKQQGQIKMTN